jgi:lipoprotein signal peptidase
MAQSSGRSPLVPLSRIAALVALGDLLTKQVAVWWVGALHPSVSSTVRFGVVHNDKGAFGLTAGDYTFELSLALTLAAIALIVPVARDLAKVDERAPGALGLIAGGAVGNLVSLVVSPAGVVDFIAVQRADGAGIVLNVADLAAYAGVAMLMRTAAMVIAAIKRNRAVAERAATAERELVLTRFADLELVRTVSREGDGAVAAHDPASAPVSGPSRSSADREVQLRVIHADGGSNRPGRGLAARLRDREGGSRPPTGSPYLRPMSHQSESRFLR